MADPVVLEHVSYHYGAGDLRRKVLDDVSLTVEAGEIVILTGPSGSGKTTLLTLIGALRSATEGSIRVLGRELCGASRATLRDTRRDIGFIFQLHNLLGALTARQNVQMALELGSTPPSERVARAERALAAVGLEREADKVPDQLSGGQNQRAAIARALVGEPALLLADEPTASLDKKSGRDVVELMRSLARDRGVAVVLVTHDNRILDVADRIVNLEDGKLVSFGHAVLSSTRRMMSLLSDANRKQDLARHVLELSVPEFHSLLDEVTADARRFLRATELASDDAFRSMLEQALAAFARRVELELRADRVSLWLLDEERGELWSKVARDAEGERVEIRIPSASGIAGRVFASGEPLRVDDAYAHPDFDRRGDQTSGYVTRSILCVPLRDDSGAVFGVAQALNRLDAAPFDDEDQALLLRLMSSMQVLLDSWRRMLQRVPRT